MKSQKICAIICEYNPLHNGHQYLIQKARELSCCDFVMCIMSGNFTQRGDIAILDKHKRAKLALNAGADIVVVGRAITASKDIKNAAESFLAELDSEEIDQFRVMTDF